MQESSHQKWIEFKQDNNFLIRQELISQYIGLVKYVVRKMIKNYPQAIEEEDLYHIGIVGLVEAIDRFDPDYGIKFETYAIPRIRGSIIDELRKLDWVPRSLRYRSNLVKEKTILLEQKLNGEISDTEVARGLGIQIEDLHAWKSAMGSINLLSLDRPMDDSTKQNMYDVIESQEQSDPMMQIESDEMKKVLLKAIKNLPEKTRLAITLYYYEKLTFKEIGEILEVSESRISQIHSETMTKLRKEMRKMIYA